MSDKKSKKHTGDMLLDETMEYFRAKASTCLTDAVMKLVERPYTVDSESVPYRCARYAALRALDKSGIAHSEGGTAAIEVWMQMPACADHKTNECICCQDTFEAQFRCRGAKWRVMLDAITTFVEYLEKNAGRDVFVTRLNGNVEYMAVDVQYRVGHNPTPVGKVPKRRPAAKPKKAKAKSKSKAGK